MKATRLRKRNRAMQDHPDVYGRLPNYSGGTRTAYVGDEWVWKVPNYSAGITQNEMEAQMYAERANGGEVEIPVAECYLLNDGVLKMRRVHTIVDLAKNADVPGALGRGYDDAPEWVYRVDSYQVGYDQNGELVAYDV